MPCPRCNDLNLDDLFAQHKIPDLLDGFLVAVINGLSRSCRRARCNVCRFLASSTSLMDSCIVADTWHLRAFDLDTILKDTIHEAHVPSQNLVMCLIPGPGDDGLDFDVNASDIILPTERKINDEGCGAGSTGRILDHKFIDYSVIRTWIDRCVNEHTSECTAVSTGTQAHDIKSMKVIDCHEEKVIAFTGGAYVALSYCIGPQQRRRRVGRIGQRGFNRRWPTVILDAIQCTKRLGYRYLWVDQVCINQEDAVELTKAISQMHLIYTHAVLTIVSLAATENDGLPGVQSVLRRRHPVLLTRNGSYISTMNSLPVAINKSKWITRAWCYQEAVLSRRLLIFSEQQVYFACDLSSYSESLNFDIDTPSPALISLRHSDYAHSAARGPDDNDIENEDEVWSFGTWVSAFTAREITFSQDMLSAFYGILSISKHQSYWGIPFVLDKLSDPGTPPLPEACTEAFTRGLTWSTSYNKNTPISYIDAPTTTHFYQRRDNFPSWSWASCRTFRSPIQYQVPGGFAAEFEAHMRMNKITPRLEINVEVLPGDIKPIFEFVGAQDSRHVLIEASRYIQVTTDAIEVKLCKIASASGDDTDLVFAKFCIRLENDVGGDDELSIIAPDSQIFEDTPNELEDGRFVIDFDRPATVKDGYHEQLHAQVFHGLVLAQRVSEDEIDEGDGEYCVMLVKPLVGDTCWVRAGLVWIAADHMELFQRQRKSYRLC